MSCSRRHPGTTPRGSIYARRLIAQVTRFAATDVADPALDMPGLRSVSYGLQKVPPKELRVPSVAYSARFAFARMIAPASRRRLTNVASSGGRSFAHTAAKLRSAEKQELIDGAEKTLGPQAGREKQ